MPRDLILDIHCRPCEQAGDPNPPRLARFARRGDDGAFGSKTHTADGRQAMTHPPEPHVRPDGGITWRLRCPWGHHKPVQQERIIAFLDALPPGTAGRISL
jgi:hypothetical protein